MKLPPKPNLLELVDEVDYKVDFRLRGLHPGKWTSMGKPGGGYSFQKYERLSNHPDFRRIDFLATSRIPMIHEPLVRVSKPASRIDVIMIADLSLSILYGFSEPKIYQVAKLATLIGNTAIRFGDRFGFIGFDNRILQELYFPPVSVQNAGLKVGEALLDFRPSGPSHGLTLKNLERFLPEKRALIVMVSDFYLEPEALRTVLQRLLRHRVFPVVLRHEKERRWPIGLFGVLRLRDSELNKEKIVFFSPRMIKAFEKEVKRKEEEIRRVFRSFSVVPIVLDEATPDRFLEEMERRWA